MIIAGKKPFIKLHIIYNMEVSHTTLGGLDSRKHFKTLLISLRWNNTPRKITHIYSNFFDYERYNDSKLYICQISEQFEFGDKNDYLKK